MLVDRSTVGALGQTETRNFRLTITSIARATHFGGSYFVTTTPIQRGLVIIPIQRCKALARIG